MRFSVLLTSAAASLMVAAPAWAQCAVGCNVPEVGTAGSLAGITAVVAVAAIIQRRRNRS